MRDGANQSFRRNRRERIRLALFLAVSLPRGAVDVGVTSTKLFFGVGEAARLLAALFTVTHARAVLGGVVGDLILGVGETAIRALRARRRARDEFTGHVPVQEAIIRADNRAALLRVEMVIETDHRLVLLAMPALELRALGGVAVQHGMAMLESVELFSLPHGHLIRGHIAQLLGTLFLDLVQHH